VFASFFLGSDLARRKLIDWEELLAGKPFRDWLQEQIDSGRLSPEQISEFANDELLARFWETVLAQQSQHHGGSTWVGTQGRSPFGHSGQHAGASVYGQIAPFGPEGDRRETLHRLQRKIISLQ
jgi:uncharacterized protein with von Willebrand factor type A (vWA) domain